MSNRGVIKVAATVSLKSLGVRPAYLPPKRIPSKKGKGSYRRQRGPVHA